MAQNTEPSDDSKPKERANIAGNKPLDYSKWEDLDFESDEDDCHPNRLKERMRREKGIKKKEPYLVDKWNVTTTNKNYAIDPTKPPKTTQEQEQKQENKNETNTSNTSNTPPPKDNTKENKPITNDNNNTNESTAKTIEPVTSSTQPENLILKFKPQIKYLIISTFVISLVFSKDIALLVIHGYNECSTVSGDSEYVSFGVNIWVLVGAILHIIAYLSSLVFLYSKWKYDMGSNLSMMITCGCCFFIVYSISWAIIGFYLYAEMENTTKAQNQCSSVVLSWSLITVLFDFCMCCLLGIR